MLIKIYFQMFGTNTVEVLTIFLAWRDLGNLIRRWL